MNTNSCCFNNFAASTWSDGGSVRPSYWLVLHNLTPQVFLLSSPFFLLTLVLYGIVFFKGHSPVLQYDNT